MAVAHEVAGQRIIMNLRDGAKSKHGAPTGIKGDALHLMSCRAEMAVAKYLDRFWSGAVGEYSAADIGPGRGIEVRGTELPHGKLIVHPDKDPDDSIFVLVIASGRVFTLVGWMKGRVAKQQQWWSDPTGEGRPAFFVPQGLLWEMDDLPKAKGRPHEHQARYNGLGIQRLGAGVGEAR
jgi:hypothetical protein